MPPLQREYPSVLGASVNITTEDLVSLTNKKRVEAGLAPLILNEQLSKAAAEKAKYMLEKNYWAHIAPDGTTPWYFIKNSGYEYLYAGENLARGYNSASDVVDAWMASPTHKENILSPNYKDIGFAVVSGTLTGTETVLVVEEFGSKYSPNERDIASDEIISDQEAAAADEPNEESTIPVESNKTAVAAAVNNPLVDSRQTTRNLSIILIGTFIVVFIVDLLIIERKQIARVVGHNLDHIIFLTMLLLAAIIIGGGVVL